MKTPADSTNCGGPYAPSGSKIQFPSGLKVPRMKSAYLFALLRLIGRPFRYVGKVAATGTVGATSIHFGPEGFMTARRLRSRSRLVDMRSPIVWRRGYASLPERDGISINACRTVPAKSQRRRPMSWGLPPDQGAPSGGTGVSLRKTSCRSWTDDAMFSGTS
jgi:hypothetical protein